MDLTSGFGNISSNETNLTKSQISDQNFQNEANAKLEFSVHAKSYFKFLSQFREVLNAFECFLTQVRANAFAKNQMCLAYEDRAFYCEGFYHINKLTADHRSCHSEDFYHVH